MNGGSGSGSGIVSYGALRCDSVTDAYESSSASASRDGHITTIALSPMIRPNPLRKKTPGESGHAKSRVNALMISHPSDHSSSSASGEEKGGKGGVGRKEGTRRTAPSIPTFAHPCYSRYLYVRAHAHTDKSWCVNGWLMYTNKK